MKTIFKNYWIITDPSGHPFMHTINYLKKDCISQFLRKGETNWSDWKKGGWNVQKIDIELKPVKP